jgi:TRAP-type C4-dicarboxylate transport system permease small subunit
MLIALERIALVATRSLAVVGLIALMSLAAMTLTDGLMRWIANQPIEGVRDLGGLAIALAIACCFPVVMIEKDNITIRLAASLSPILSRVLEALAAALVCAVIAALSWQIWLYAAKMARAKETTFVLQIPVAPFWYGVSAIFACATLVQLLVTLHAMSDISRR